MARNYMEPGVYRIVNEASGTVIDLSAGDNKTVIGWTKNSGNNQLVRVAPFSSVLADSYALVRANGLRPVEDFRARRA